MDRSLLDLQRDMQRVDEEVARAVREAQQQVPSVRVERSEARSYSSYRWVAAAWACGRLSRARGGTGSPARVGKMGWDGACLGWGWRRARSLRPL
jgi:hypothetical protein